MEDKDLHQVDSVLDLASTSSTVSSIFGSDDVPSSSGDISAASSSFSEIPSALLAVPPRLVVGPPVLEAASVAVSGRVKCVGRNNKGVTWGFTSVIGRRREMEDVVAIVPGFMTRTCNHVGGCTASGSRSSGEISPLHFFAVYDGHSGSQINPLQVLYEIKNHDQAVNTPTHSFYPRFVSSPTCTFASTLVHHSSAAGATKELSHVTPRREGSGP
ncbi:unnamed protein product [Camellia sinensis]